VTIQLASSPLPTRHAVRNTIQDLIGRDVDLADGVPPEAKATNVVAVYVTDQLAVTAIAVCNLECAVRIGGALGLVPKGALDDAIKAREMPKNVEENCYEVLNVLAAVFNLPNAPHVRLYEMHGPGAVLPPDVAKLGATVGSRMDVALKIAGYGDGLLSIIVR
jgi:hypothetical protein